jgi:hypothetical protein
MPQHRGLDGQRVITHQQLKTILASAYTQATRGSSRQSGVTHAGTRSAPTATAAKAPSEPAPRADADADTVAMRNMVAYVNELLDDTRTDAPAPRAGGCRVPCNSVKPREGRADGDHKPQLRRRSEAVAMLRQTTLQVQGHPQEKARPTLTPRWVS